MAIRLAEPKPSQLLRLLEHIARDPAALFLTLLIATDAVFCGLYAAKLVPLEDSGAAEVFQFCKEGWSGALFVALAIRRQEPRYVAWAALSFWLLLDDSLLIHERLGHEVAVSLGIISLGYPAQELGELLVMSVMGAVVVSVIGAIYYTAPQATRAVFRTCVRLVALLLVFGVGVDYAHGPIDRALHLPGRLMVLLEEGGEMFAMSLLCGYVFREAAAREAEEMGEREEAGK
jgi:hypothetical protein